MHKISVRLCAKDSEFQNNLQTLRKQTEYNRKQCKSRECKTNKL